MDIDSDNLNVYLGVRLTDEPFFRLPLKDVSTSKTVAEVKSDVEALLKNKSAELEFIYGGRKLADDKTLADHRIRPNSTIHVLRRPAPPPANATQPAHRPILQKGAVADAVIALRKFSVQMSMDKSFSAAVIRDVLDAYPAFYAELGAYALLRNLQLWQKMGKTEFAKRIADAYPILIQSAPFVVQSYLRHSGSRVTVLPEGAALLGSSELADEPPRLPSPIAHADGSIPSVPRYVTHRIISRNQLANALLLAAGGTLPPRQRQQPAAAEAAAAAAAAAALAADADDDEMDADAVEAAFDMLPASPAPFPPLWPAPGSSSSSSASSASSSTGGASSSGSSTTSSSTSSLANIGLPAAAALAGASTAAPVPAAAVAAPAGRISNAAFSNALRDAYRGRPGALVTSSGDASIAEVANEGAAPAAASAPAPAAALGAEQPLATPADAAPATQASGDNEDPDSVALTPGGLERMRAQYGTQLQQMREMGLMNEARNMRALIICRGNVVRAIHIRLGDDD